MQSVHAHGGIREKEDEGKMDALHATPFPLSYFVPLTLFNNMLRTRRLSKFLA